MKTKSKIQKPLSQVEPPKYYLADVPHALRSRALDLCTRRLWHEAMEFLQQHGFNDYTLADLSSFYDWAPATLEPDSPEPEPTKLSPSG